MNKYQKLLEYVNFVDQAASLAPLNRRDHVALQGAITELRDYFEARIQESVAKPAPDKPATATKLPQA